MASKTISRGQVGCLIYDWLPVRELVIENAKKSAEFCLTALKSGEITLLEDTSGLVPYGFTTKAFDNTADGLDAEVHFGLIELIGSSTLAGQNPGSPAEAVFNDQVTHKGGASTANLDCGLLFSNDSDLSNGVWLEVTPMARILATLL